MIKTESIKNQLQMQFNKACNNITYEDMSKVYSLFVCGIGLDEQALEYHLEELKQFPLLNAVTFKGIKFNKIDIEILSDLPNIKKMNFINCYLEDLELFVDEYESLSFDNCIVNDYTPIMKMSRLQKLEIIKPYNDFNFDISSVQLTNLHSLNLNGVANKSVENLELINILPSLKTLFILNAPVVVDSLSLDTEIQNFYLSHDIYDSYREIFANYPQVVFHRGTEGLLAKADLFL